MANKNDRLIVAYYADEDAAEAAADEIIRWDKANTAIRLGAIAVLTLDPDTGKLRHHEVGQRETKSGALWGTAIGATAAVLSGGIALIPGILVGAGAGAGIGALKTRSVELTDEDAVRIANNLRDGLAALAVMADDFEVEATMAKMIQEGGRTAEFFVLAEDIAEALTKAAEAQEAAAEAVDKAIDDAIAEAEDAVAADELDLPEDQLAAVNGLVVTFDLTPVEANKLRLAGIDKGTTFYKTAATPEGRDELAGVTGFDVDSIYRLEKMLDLMRIDGVGPKYARLLLVSGVDTVPVLARRNPANLHAKMAETNEKEQVVGALPSEQEVPDWVKQANELPKVIIT